ncbi:TIM-barrel-protein domain-containing protein [Triangularia verruculosa]|uniref:TIM-barrel-protein domain-containing protein n=1 Tax=Triangularia verruculosa TaxID=2587418 RepID=A0AAN6XD01_9PEZI|nr:TIM-barrel-protein domain-containing protein [Triangularia verruculosa]
MAPPTDRHEILHHLRSQITAGIPILGSGAGIGLSAKFVEAGGGDLIIIYNSGKFRMAGRGSLAGLMPYGNANDIMLEMAKEILPVVQNTPVLAGICASDPYLPPSLPSYLRHLKSLGLCGVQNFPTVGLIDGQFRLHLEQTGMGYDLEVSLIKEARALDMLTTPYVFNPEEAKKMAKAGADIVVAHMGLTTGGSIGAEESGERGKALDDCVERVQAIRDGVHAVNPEIIVLCHGGAIVTPEDAGYVLERTKGVHGFYGASSIERLPVEKAVTEVTKAFKGLKMGGRT